MFKKSSWYALTFKALLFAGILYKISGMFMKSAAKMLSREKKKQSRSDFIEDIRRMLEGADNKK